MTRQDFKYASTGGHVTVEETPLSCIVRELEEELETIKEINDEINNEMPKPWYEYGFGFSEK